MPIKFSNDKPIFIQLSELIKNDIISGKFKPTEKLPTVREFAFTYAINPNTVQKALQLLEEENLIKTDSTNGKFVSDNQKQLSEQKNNTIQNEVKTFITKMQQLGLTIDEIKQLINKQGE